MKTKIANHNLAAHKDFIAMRPIHAHQNKPYHCTIGFRQDYDEGLIPRVVVTSDQQF